MFYACNDETLVNFVKRIQDETYKMWDIPIVSKPKTSLIKKTHNEITYTYPHEISFQRSKPITYQYIPDASAMQIPAHNVKKYIATPSLYSHEVAIPEYVVMKILPLNSPHGANEAAIMNKILSDAEFILLRSRYEGLWPTFLNKIYSVKDITHNEVDYKYVLISYEGVDPETYLEDKSESIKYDTYKKLKDITFSMHREMGLVYSDMKVPNFRLRIHQDEHGKDIINPVFVDIGGMCVKPENSKETVLCATTYSTHHFVSHCSLDVERCLHLGLLFTSLCIVSRETRRYVLENMSHNKVTKKMASVWTQRSWFLTHKSEIDRDIKKMEGINQKTYNWFYRHCFNINLADNIMKLMLILIQKIESARESQEDGQVPVEKQMCFTFHIIRDALHLIKPLNDALLKDNNHFNQEGQLNILSDEFMERTRRIIGDKMR
jgi:hypothetical protein